MFRTASFALVGAVLCGGAQAAGPMTMDHGAAMPAASAAPGRAQTSADKAFSASSAAMMKGMDVQPSGDADRDFVMMMLPHHRGAVDMARVEVQYGRDPVLRKLAADIIRAQGIEIAQMQGWQKRHRR